ncbi:MULTISPECIES: hypothetical protein [Citrobacter freundii complex]|uniref:hypothetical protein n=1 Tax=Citrobacter freundii complex TaxID=1344959 RepID=UPI001E4E819F|nr:MULTISPECIES: hypothetical protein [Citrobacter freundii complex]MCR3706741.1 hypothetical protein [Citrobacter freundii]MDT7438175.1 hypothetical protein [Citrobacter freundii]
MNNVECYSLTAEPTDLPANGVAVGKSQSDKLKRFFKKRRRTETVVKTAKTMLVHGIQPGKVALLLRLDPEFTAELAKIWNPRFRRVKHTNQHKTGVTVRQYFDSGAMLEKICADLQLPLFSVITFLQRDGVSDQEISSRMPVSDDPLFIEYWKTISRKQVAPQRRSPRLHY